MYGPLAFCVGAALLFSAERGRRRDRLDWTHRWGVLFTCVVLLLSATQVLFLAAMVLTGIAASFQTLPLKYQPEVTPLFIRLSTTYMRYGPHPLSAAGVVQVASASIVILLACIPLFDALRSSGPKRLAAALLAPLAMFTLLHLAQAAWYGFGVSPTADLFAYGVYFRPEILVSRIPGQPAFLIVPASTGAVLAEGVKWCVVLAIAAWLTTAQLATWRRRNKSGAA